MLCWLVSALCWCQMCCWGDGMKKTDIIRRLETLEFDKNEYWVITGSAMVLYGLREETHDIDLGCTKKMADELDQRGFPVSLLDDGTRKILCGPDVEIFENWLYGEVQWLNGIPVISLEGLAEMKRSLGRDKDYRDIALIEHILSGK